MNNMLKLALTALASAGSGEPGRRRGPEGSQDVHIAFVVHGSASDRYGRWSSGASTTAPP